MVALTDIIGNEISAHFELLAVTDKDETSSCMPKANTKESLLHARHLKSIFPVSSPHASCNPMIQCCHQPHHIYKRWMHNCKVDQPKFHTSGKSDSSYLETNSQVLSSTSTILKTFCICKGELNQI